MNTFKKIFAVAATVGLMAIAPLASALTISVSNPSFTVGSGYGTSSNNTTNNNLLDVLFTNGAAAAQSLVLTTPGQPVAFNFGTVNFSETNIGSGETNDLGMTALLNLVDPLGVLHGLQLTGTGTAFTGNVDDRSTFFGIPYGTDSTVDYTLTWAPATFSYGNGGKLSVDLNDLSFVRNGSLNLGGTVTLVSASQVPEPTTVALLGLGLLGFAASRRKSAKSKNA